MDAMISLQVSSTESVAKELNAFLRSKGYTTWICVEMDGGATYREEIVVNAAGSKCLIALMNMRWAESKECRYEFNIATRSNLTKGTPQIIPVIMESFDFGPYPLITGIMANTNAIFFNPSNPADTWNKVLAAMQMYIQPLSPDVTVTTSVPTPIPQEPLPDKMIEWKTKHVAQWIQSLGLAGDPADIFTKNWVDGIMLQDITAQELQDSLKFTGLQTKRFLRELNEFKNRKKVPAPAPLSVTQVGGAMFRMGGAVTSTVTSTVASTVVGVGQQVGSTVVGVIPGGRGKWNRSNKGFSTGLWEGSYEYNHGQKDKMAMDVTMIGGVIAGYGTDTVGEFYVQGVYDDNVLSCAWDKEYVGQHTVSYSGKLEGGRIKGKWEIKDNGSGQFELALKKVK